MRAALEILFGGLQVGTWLLLFAAAVHLLRAASWAAGRAMADQTPPLDGELPAVTVQLPIRNERAVAERLLRTVCALDWPRDRLQVQALDDSDDETSAILDQVAAELRAAGHDVTVSRRAERTGFKAGNLQSGLATTRGEYLAVFDADSQPPPDFLKRTVPHLAADAKLAFVQSRWSFDNERAGLLTRIQALILHGLFAVEQSRLSDEKKPLQFNGTCGVWRTSALRDAGGWASSSVTEDLDLSYRVQLTGLRGVMLPSLTVDTELPPTLAAFRAQQSRWVRGSGEALRALARRILRGDAPAGAKLSMLVHLLRHARQPWLVLFLLAWPILVLMQLSPAPRLAPAIAVGARTAAHAATTHLTVPRWDLPYAWPALLLIIYLAIAFYYGAALERIGRAPITAFVFAPLIIALSIGLCIPLATSLLAGLLAGPGEFVRTPKGGAYRVRRPVAATAEVLLGLGYLALAMLAALKGQYTLAAGQAMVASGLLWVGVRSLS